MISAGTAKSKICKQAHFNSPQENTPRIRKQQQQREHLKGNITTFFTVFEFLFKVHWFM